MRNLSDSIEVGDIFAVIWGYSMTLAAFYKVVSKTASSVKVVKLCQHKNYADKFHLQGAYTATPIDEIDMSDPNPKTRRLRLSEYYGVCFTDKEYQATAVKWDGEPIHCNDMD